MTLGKVRDQILTLVAGAFAFVAAFFWNDAIKSWIEAVVPPGDSLIYKFYVAIIVTIIAAIVLYFISKMKKE